MNNQNIIKLIIGLFLLFGLLSSLTSCSSYDIRRKNKLKMSQDSLDRAIAKRDDLPENVFKAITLTNHITIPALCKDEYKNIYNSGDTVWVKLENNSICEQDMMMGSEEEDHTTIGDKIYIRCVLK